MSDELARFHERGPGYFEEMVCAVDVIGSIPGGVVPVQFRAAQLANLSRSRVTLRRDVYACRISGHEVVTKHDEAGPIENTRRGGCADFEREGFSCV